MALRHLLIVASVIVTPQAHADSYYRLVAVQQSDHRFDLIGTWSGHYDCKTGEKQTEYEFSEYNGSVEAREKFRAFFTTKIVEYTFRAESSRTFILSTDAFGGYKIRITLSDNGRQIRGRYIGHPECQSVSLERDM